MAYYKRSGLLGSLPPVTRNLLIINIIVFALFELLSYLGYKMLMVKYLALFPFKSGYFNPVQLVTHMFMHWTFMHIFFNMFGLFLFGRVLETAIGSKKFFILYILSGLGAAFLQLAVFRLRFDPAHPVIAPMMGASGAIFGVLAAFAVMFPNVELMLIFLPIPIKAKYFIPIYAVIELFMGVVNFSGDNIAHFAHLGGAIVGFILIKIWKKNQFKIY